MRGTNLSLAVVKSPQAAENGISVFVADSDQFVRCGLLYVLGKAELLRPTGDAGDAKAALEGITQLQPQVAIVSDKLQGVGIMELLSAIKARSLETKILVLGNDDTGTNLQSILQAGALGYCLRTCPPKILLSALQAVSQGAIWIDPALASFFAQFPICATTLPAKDPETGLSSREIEVLRLVAAGMGNLQIAAKLYISPETVKTHIKHIMEKLAAHDRTEAAVKAIRNGLV
jgi:DNA-binding NarL/FixJ family response regulator